MSVFTFWLDNSTSIISCLIWYKRTIRNDVPKIKIDGSIKWFHATLARGKISSIKNWYKHL